MSGMVAVISIPNGHAESHAFCPNDNGDSAYPLGINMTMTATMPDSCQMHARRGLGRRMVGTFMKAEGVRSIYHYRHRLHR